MGINPARRFVAENAAHGATPLPCGSGSREQVLESTMKKLGIPKALGCALCLAALAASAAHAQEKKHLPKTTTPPPLQFHYMGPPAGGRVASVAGVPGDYSTYYLGAASGGLWKSTDGGHTFLPIFDDQDTSAIGAIAVAPSDSDTVWVGTGERWFIRPSDIWGDGVYKSTDAGKTWQHMGLTDTGRIARVASIRRIPTTCWSAPKGAATARNTSAASTAPPTAARP